MLSVGLHARLVNNWPSFFGKLQKAQSSDPDTRVQSGGCPHFAPSVLYSSAVTTEIPVRWGMLATVAVVALGFGACGDAFSTAAAGAGASAGGSDDGQGGSAGDGSGSGSGGEVGSSGGFAGCRDDGDCSSERPACDVLTGDCVACNAANACAADEICVNGSCVPEGECQPGSSSCVGDILVVCSDTGMVEATVDCDSLGQSCSAGTCAGSCTPNQRRCASNQVIQCNAAGTQEGVVDVCTDAEFCDPTTLTCVPLVCVPNSAGCDESVVIECNRDGTAFLEPVDCAEIGLECRGGQCTDPTQTLLIDFDEVEAPLVLQDALPLTDEYAHLGVLFSGPTPADGGAIGSDETFLPISGYSPPNFLSFNCNATMLNGGTPCPPETLSFDPPVTAVTMVAIGTEGTTMTVVGYDGGTEVDNDAAGLSSTAETLTVSGSSITRIVIDYESIYTVVVDDIEFTR